METLVEAVRDHQFVGDDGKEIKGKYIYLLITHQDGRQDDRRVFVGEDRLLEFAHIPAEGDKVRVYASNGKVVDMLKV